jgi:hypothetical protein
MLLILNLDIMQKFTDFLNAVGAALTGAAKLFQELNTYRESSRRELTVKSCDNNKKTDK